MTTVVVGIFGEKLVTILQCCCATTSESPRTGYRRPRAKSIITVCDWPAAAPSSPNVPKTLKALHDYFIYYTIIYTILYTTDGFSAGDFCWRGFNVRHTRETRWHDRVRTINSRSFGLSKILNCSCFLCTGGFLSAVDSTTITFRNIYRISRSIV